MKGKAAFTTPEGSFEPTIMFFELTNLLVIFQAMMNKSLRNLIKVGSFIDDIILGIKIKERYNELVEEILKKLKENDLYVKPEKCK